MKKKNRVKEGPLGHQKLPGKIMRPSNAVHWMHYKDWRVCLATISLPFLRHCPPDTVSQSTTTRFSTGRSERCFSNAMDRILLYKVTPTQTNNVISYGFYCSLKISCSTSLPTQVLRLHFHLGSLGTVGGKPLMPKTITATSSAIGINTTVL